MQDRTVMTKQVNEFKARYGVQDQDEHIITTIHLMNTYRVDLSRAQDQTSHGANDRGIDGWQFDEKTGTLFVFQSKLTSSKPIAVAGFDGLLQAAEWIATVLSTGDVGGKLSNAALYNLARCLDQTKTKLKNVELLLISPFNPNELLDCSEYEEARKELVRSPLNAILTEKGGKFDIRPESYNMSPILPSAFSSYQVSGLPGTAIQLGRKTQLQVVYLKLAGLVELLRRRGNRLFDKNVRLFLNTKESQVRLEHPLEDTLERICSGILEPAIFPFYHVGITLIAGSSHPADDNSFLLETPNIINGCQTINIADRYLRKLEKEKDKDRAAEKIKRFNEVPVLAKIVIAATDDQVREIANCNNRQNPIESWQLFSNDSIHIRIEEAFLGAGIFYERQKGKFDAEMKFAENLNRYHSTNNTKIAVEDLGQLIALCRRDLQTAAKPSDIYTNKQSHDLVFDWTIPNKVHDAVWAFNAFKSVKVGLRNYLKTPAHDNETTYGVFGKQLVRQCLHYAAMMHLYQECGELAGYYGFKLNKKAPPRLTREAESFYRKVIAKTKAWYLTESDQLNVVVSWKKLDSFLNQLCHEAGLDSEGSMPLTDRSIDWSGYSEPEDPEPA